MLKPVIVATVLSACALLGADFFPLQDGNTWTYREPATGQTFTVRVGAPVTSGGKVYHRLTGYAESDLLVRIEEVYGALVYLDEARGQEILLTSFEPFERGWWIAPKRLCEQEGQTLEKRGNHDGPAGPVADVLEIRYRTFTCADAGLEQEQYAEHLGMLRRTETSFAGPRRYDLIHARVGNLVIDAAPSARFSVAVDIGAASTTFRLQNNSPAPLKLPFSSGQEYDFVLKDSDGNALWTWSRGIMFIQSLHQRTVTDEWSVTVLVPWAGTLQPGAYTVEAWVTTTGFSPRFAATVPFTIAPPGSVSTAIKRPDRLAEIDRRSSR